MLCSACRQIFDDTPKVPSGAKGLFWRRLWRHHPYPYLIETASQDGCQICRLLWDKFTPLEKEGLRATVPKISPILPSFPIVAALLAFTPLRSALLPTMAACCFCDVVLRPIWRLVRPALKLPTHMASALEPFRYLYRSWRVIFRGLDWELYGWQVDLAAAEYSHLTIEFAFAALNWDYIPVALFPADGKYALRACCASSVD